VGSPFGYAPDLVRACCAGLLRGKKIRIRPSHGDDITSYQDPGVRDVFTRDRDFRKAEFFPAQEGDVTQRDRIAIRKFFETYFQVDLDPDDEPIADAAFMHFPGKREQLRELEWRFNDLPNRPALPPALQKLGQALENSCRSRLVQKTVVEVKRNLDILRDGVEQLGIVDSELTGDAIDTLKRAARVHDNELAQLRVIEALAGLEDDQAITSQLALERSWQEVHRIVPALDRIRERYVEVRRGLLSRQSAEAEAAQSRIKARPGFERLDADQAHRVLLPIAEALVDTTDQVIAPTLAELRDRFAGLIARAEEKANDLLDQELNKVAAVPVVKVEAQLRGRELTSREQLRALFEELEERIGPLLDRGDRVRLV
jgi:hypothetical protein